MPRDYRLINFNGEWQVCSKACRGINGERIVWIYGKERVYFCDVGKESAVYQLPGSEKENFFGDRFTYSIEEVYEDGRRMERLGGMNNVVAAQRAFTELLSHNSKRTRLMLRHGSFVMRDEFGKNDYRERNLTEAEERKGLMGGAA